MLPTRTALARIALVVLLLGSLPRSAVQASDAPESSPNQDTVDVTTLSPASEAKGVGAGGERGVELGTTGEPEAPSAAPADGGAGEPAGPALDETDGARAGDEGHDASDDEPVTDGDALAGDGAAPPVAGAAAEDDRVEVPPALEAVQASCAELTALLAGVPAPQREALPEDVQALLAQREGNPVVRALGDVAAGSEGAVALLTAQGDEPVEELRDLAGGRGFASTIGTPVRVGPAQSRPGIGVETVFRATSGTVEQETTLRSGADRFTIRARLQARAAYCPASVSGTAGDAQLFVSARELLAYTQRSDARGRIELKELSLATAPNAPGGTRSTWAYELVRGDGELALTLLPNGSVAIDVVRAGARDVLGTDDETARARSAVLRVLGDRLRDVSRVGVLAPPVAVAADGSALAGRYEVDGRALTVAFDAPASAYPLLIDPTTDYLQWVGGDGDDVVVDLASDGGVIYAAGVASSAASFAPLALSGSFVGLTQGFLLAIEDGDAPTPRWGVWIGGDGVDGIDALDVSGDVVHVAGLTYSATGWDVAPTGTISATGSSAFVAKVTVDASPALDWVTLVSGDGTSEATGVARVGSAVYVAGNASSSASWNPAYAGAFAGSCETFLARYDDGAAPTFTWGQWLGGDGCDRAFDLAAANGALYLVGSTSDGAGWEPGALTAGSYAGAQEGFLLKLIDAGAGATSAWGTFLGGDGSDVAGAIDVNGGQLYVVGVGDSDAAWEAFGTVVGAYQGNQDGWLAKVADGAAPGLAWRTWIGGDSIDDAYSVAVEGSRVFVGGTSADAAGWPAVPTYGAQLADEGFVVEVDDGASPTVAWLQWVGGSGTDGVRGVTVRGTSVFAGGQTDWPFDWEPFVSSGSPVNAWDAFVARLSATPATEAPPAPNGALRLTLEGPDSFGPSAVTARTVAVGQVFPVSVLVETDTPTSAVSHVGFTLTFDTADFHLVDPATGADLTSVPAGPATVGSTHVLFQGAANFPAAGASNSVDTTSPAGSVVLAYGSDPTDADTQVYTPGDADGLDRLVTLYVRAQRAVTDGVITFAADTPGTTNELLRTGDWVGFGTPARERVYVDADDDQTVSVGDARLAVEDGSTLATGVLVASGDADVGDTLAAGIMADVRFTDTDLSGGWDVGEPVYQNFNAGNDWVDLAEIRIWHPTLPTGLVLAGNADLGTGGLLHLPRVRQTGAGGSGEDLVGTVGSSLLGVTVSATSPTSVTVTPRSNCILTSFDGITVEVAVTPALEGVPVTLTPSDATSLTVAAVAPLQDAATALTDSAGVARFTVAASADVTGVTFTALAGGTAGGPSAPVMARTGNCMDVAQSSLAADASCGLANGTDAHVVTATVRSDAGTPVTGRTVFFDVSGSATRTPASATLDAAGQATFTVTDSTEELVTLRASLDTSGEVLTDTITFAASCAAVTPVLTASTSRIDAAPLCVAPGASSTVTVALRDQTGAAYTGSTTVSLTPSPATGVTVTPATVTTTSGTATFALSSATAQTVGLSATATSGATTVTVSTASVTGGSSVVVATICGTPSPAATTTTASSACVQSDGSATATITVTARDIASLAIPNATVTLTQTGSSTISPSSAVTSASGVATFTVWSSSSQTVTYTAVVNGVSTSSTSVQFARSCSTSSGIVDPDRSRISADESCAANDGDAEVEVTVTARDEDGDPVSGVTVSLYQDGEADIEDDTDTTDARGEATFTVTSEENEEVTFTASAGGYLLDDDVDVEFRPYCSDAEAVRPSAARSTAYGDPCYTVGQGGMVAFTLRDDTGMPIPGASVRVSAVPADGVTVAPAAATTGADGQVLIRVDSAREQTVQFAFTADDPSSGPAVVYTHTGVFRTSCMTTLPQTGSLDALALGAAGTLAALPPSLAAWRRRRTAHRRARA